MFEFRRRKAIGNGQTAQQKQPAKAEGEESISTIKTAVIVKTFGGGIIWPEKKKEAGFWEAFLKSFFNGPIWERG